MAFNKLKKTNIVAKIVMWTHWFRIIVDFVSEDIARNIIYLFVRIGEASLGVDCKHVEQGKLAPLVHIRQ